MTVTHTLPELHVAFTPEKRKKRKRPREKGYKLDSKRQDRRVLLSEHQVMEARWLREFGGWTVLRIAEHFGLQYGYALNLLSYYVRSKLRPPRRDDFPDGYTPTRPAKRGLP